MNAFVKELAEQAGWMMGDEVDGFTVRLEKFAELFVQECEKVINNGRYSDMACEGNSHRISYNNGRYGAVVDIQKHFGTEQ